MAVEASLLNRAVFEFHFFYRICQACMAPEAEIIPRGREIELVLCRVRIVAFDAIPLTHDLVDTACLFGDYVRMARETDLVRSRCQHFPVRRCVGIMAA